MPLLWVIWVPVLLWNSFYISMTMRCPGSVFHTLKLWPSPLINIVFYIHSCLISFPSPTAVLLRVVSWTGVGPQCTTKCKSWEWAFETYTRFMSIEPDPPPKIPKMFCTPLFFFVFLTFTLIIFYKISMTN